MCYDINLVFDDQTILLVQPCEVEISGCYPSLGLALEKIETASLSEPFNVSDLPMRVKEVIQTDYLGEDAINQYVLLVENGNKIIIRHVFPPMTMGIRLEDKNA